MDDRDEAIENLRHIVRTFPAVDNHAHNLLLPSYLESQPFESITTEAHGGALEDTFKSLSHLRAERQLRELYECDPNANWDAILAKRAQWLRESPDQLARKCMEGIHSILMDDGLGGADTVHVYDWHDRLTMGPTKRILRIETIAEQLMEGILKDASQDDLGVAEYLADTWVLFTEEFEREIMEAIQDFDVVGFKSVVCYRTGLDIEPEYGQVLRKIGSSFEHYVSRSVQKRRYRIQRKTFNDYLVLKTLELLAENPLPTGMSKPIQFHTGLGDNDIRLIRSNPGYMQPLIEEYPEVPFVILHSAYPYTREAGYLATVFKHVHLDLGEVFPMLSRDGQKSVLREAFELVPASKLLFSTDGHHFPETYWLASKQFREVFEELLVEYVEKRDLTADQASKIAQDIYFNNSRRLYSLQLPDPPIPERKKSILAITEQGEHNTGALPLLTKSTSAEQEQPRSEPKTSPMLAPVSTSTPSQPRGHKQPLAQYSIEIFKSFKSAHPDIQYIYVQYVDYMGTSRTRILPISQFSSILEKGSRIGISRGNTGTLQNDTVTSAANTTGQIYMEPDLRTLRRTSSKDPLTSATVLAFWKDEYGETLPGCPRGALQALASELGRKYGVYLTMGFEIEVTFLRRTANFSASPAPTNPTPNIPKPETSEPYEPITKTHAWGTLSPEQWTIAMPLLAEMTKELENIGITVQQFHAESGQGQYEFVLAPLPALAAIDAMYQARQLIAQIAESHQMRVTLHPQPFPGISTAAHVHIGFNSVDGRELVDQDYGFFVEGVMKHLEAICAYSLPEEVSYGRVVDDHWTGGTWVAWGTQNRETPIRRVEDGRWEVRALDGMANMYLVCSAVVAAGLLGLSGDSVVEVKDDEEDRGEKRPRQLRDCPYNPSKMTDEQRLEYGITRRLPTCLSEALMALEKDIHLKEALAPGLVDDFVVMKKAEQEMLENMEDRERRIWLIERY